MGEEQEVRNMVFHISCTEKEYKKAYRMVQWRMGVLRYWPVVVMFSLLSFVTGFYLLQMQTPFLWATLLFWGVAFLLLVGYIVYGQLYIKKRIRHYWHFYREFGPTKELSLHQRGFLLFTDSFRMPFDFVDCRWLIDRKDFYLLIENEKCFLLIPKRDVPPEKRETFQKFLHEAYKNRYRLD